jgi:hypothetical protein
MKHLNQQKIMYQLALTLGRNHPEMFAKLKDMTQVQVAEFISTTYNVTLEKGTPWDEIPKIIDVMDEEYYVRDTK